MLQHSMTRSLLCKHSTSLFGCPCRSYISTLKTLWTMSHFFGSRHSGYGSALADSSECFCFLFGIQISHAFCTTAINEHTQFTFIYSSCDWMKWKAAANEHQEDILVTGSEWHCTWPRCLFSFSFSVLHCIVNIALFVPVKNWWVFLTQKSNRNPPPP